MTTLLSTAYFPNIFYIQKIIESNKILIEIYEHFPKQTFRNRCEILAANGVMPLIVPVQKGRSGKRFTKDIKISYAEEWQKNHKNSIESAYKSSPYFEFYWDYFVHFFEKKYNYLIDLNTEILHSLLNILQIQRDIEFTKDFVQPENNFNDFRFVNTPKNKPVTNEKYIQVFSDRFAYYPNLSILDAIFNLGPETLITIKN